MSTTAVRNPKYSTVNKDDIAFFQSVLGADNVLTDKDDIAVRIHMYITPCLQLLQQNQIYTPYFPFARTTIELTSGYIVAPH